MPNENELQTTRDEETASKPQSPKSIQDNIIDGLIADIIPIEGEVEKDDIVDTINGILKDYNLSTNDSFIERIAKMKLNQRVER